MIDICPRPRVWYDIYKHLNRAWESFGLESDPPPKPIVLGAWYSSSDLVKQMQWKQTLRWAERHDLTHLIPTIADKDIHRVKNPTVHLFPQLGDPVYLPRDMEGKTKPNGDDVQTALTKLQENWADIVGSTLAPITDPIGFTGNKKRRLLVRADLSATPPWGGWTWRVKGHERRTFTDFRSAVNAAIKPLHVDHIDFEISE